MPINAINSYNQNITKPKKSVINAKTTGYACLTSLGITMLTSMAKNKTVKKFHLPLGIFTALLAAFHFGVIEGKS